MSVMTRLLSADDVDELTVLLRKNREFLAPWEPLREDDHFLVGRQREIVAQYIKAHAEGTMPPLVILDSAGAIVGSMNLSGITRGAFQSAALGYWVSRDANGMGLATAAVAEAIDIAFGPLGLHRLQAETLFANGASQRVLSKNGFRPYGVAPQYLKINGRWQDCILYQRIAD